MRKTLIGLTLMGTLLLAGCSSSAASDTYVPPGAELGDTVVDPPAALPPAIEVDDETNPTDSLSECAPVENVIDLAIATINDPLGTATASPSLTGEKVVSAKEMPVTTLYQKDFGYLIEATLDSGKTVWFGSPASINLESTYVRIQLQEKRAEIIFGANTETYDTFIYGPAGVDSALVAEGNKVVEEYSHCF